MKNAVKNTRQPQPPRWARAFLSWYCRPELLEDLEGDLNEYFDRHVRDKGVRHARWMYVADVLKFCRLYTIRRPKFTGLFISWIMIDSYIKTAWRSMKRHRLFSGINVVGMAVSMCVGLIMIAMLWDLHSYDRFHEKYHRIYRVTSNYGHPGQANEGTYATTSIRIGEAIGESVASVEKVAVLKRGLGDDLKVGEKVIPASGFWASEQLFDVFTFPFVQGNPATALREPFSMVVTERTAARLFGQDVALGKTVMVGERPYVVTGVVRNVPEFSHFTFDVLTSLSTRKILERDRPDKEMAWGDILDNYIYLLTPPETDLAAFQTQLDALSRKESAALKNIEIHVNLQPLSDIALGPDLNNAIGPVMVKRTVWMMGILAAIVIFSACLNYANLSIARAIRRGREVGVRKVIGAGGGAVMMQFIIEAMVIAVLALILAFGLFVIVKPYFLLIDPHYGSMLRLDLSPALVLGFVALAVVVGLLAGLLPALFFSRVRALQVMKAVPVGKSSGQVALRKVLTVTQYAVSITFIATTLIGFRQYRQYLSCDLGFNTAQVLNIGLYSKPDGLIAGLRQMPEVQAVSTSSLIAGIGNYWAARLKYPATGDSTQAFYNAVDEHYLPLYGHRFLAGRNFIPRAEGATESEVIVSAEVLRQFGIVDALKAIGETVVVEHKPLQIVGVVEDFHYGIASNTQTLPVFFRNRPNMAQFVNVKIDSRDWPATWAKLERLWHEVDHVHPLSARFYDDEIAQAFGDLSSQIKMIGTLAFLAICIASIGLLGMVIFTTESRLKEISIRKVLGASEGRLVYLLSEGFIFMLGISAMIAIPATYFFCGRMIFQDYAVDATHGVFEFVLGIAGVLCVSLVVIGTQTLKVARTNPADTLKQE